MTLPVLACYQQPIANLAVWRARGCTAAVGPELGNPPATTSAKWCAEAQRLGMGVIGNKFLLADKYVPPNLIAWYVDDEFNETNHQTPPAQVKAQADAMRALAKVPVIGNFGGDRLTSAGPADAATNEAYVKALDVCSQDWHVKNRQADRYPIALIGQALDYLKAHGAAVVGSHIETSWQELNSASPLGRAPTPDELEAEVDMAVAHGASYIIYFSTAERGHWGWPKNYDPTTDDVAARITAVNARLTPTPPAPDVNQRLTLLESQVSAQATTIAVQGDAINAQSGLIQDLRGRLAKAAQAFAPPP